MADETSNVDLPTELTIAWLGNPNTRAGAAEVPAFLQAMHDAVARLSQRKAEPAMEAAEPDHLPAVSVRKSLASPDHILSMIDGKPYKALRRHLSRHGLTPEQYRERYNLKADYPMVASSYSEARRVMAHQIGLGRTGAGKPAAAAKAEAAPSASKPARRKRRVSSPAG